MAAYYYDTCGKLREIFTEHCNLSVEQYWEISAQFIYLVADIQDHKPMAEIERRIGYMLAVFEFLYNTKEIWDKEYTELQELVEKIRTDAVREAAKVALEKGTVL